MGMPRKQLCFSPKGPPGSSAGTSTADCFSECASNFGGSDDIDSSEVCSCCSPSSDAVEVKNTFIDIPTPELLALKVGAMKRSHSVPRNMGSRTRKVDQVTCPSRPA